MKLKMIAVAAAVLSLTGTSHAALTPSGSGNGSFALLAFNTSTAAWYIRDLGFLINTFLPNSSTPLSGDGGVQGDKTPATGLTLDKTNTANFGDASFSTWFGAQANAATNVRWFVGATDNVSNSASQDQRRFVVSSLNGSQAFTNGAVDTFTSGANFGGLTSFFGSATLSATGGAMNTNAYGGFGSGIGAANTAAVGQSASLYYVVRSAYTGGSSNSATIDKFDNATGAATVTLSANGDFVYSLPGAPVGEVPLPAAAWMMGAGLLAIGGMIRRRRADALA